MIAAGSRMRSTSSGSGTRIEDAVIVVIVKISADQSRWKASAVRVETFSARLVSPSTAVLFSATLLRMVERHTNQVSGSESSALSVAVQVPVKSVSSLFSLRFVVGSTDRRYEPASPPFSVTAAVSMAGS